MDIGDHNVISKITDPGGVAQAEKMFNITYNDKKPILLILQKHPDDLQADDRVIKIQLGDFETEDEIRNFLSKLTKLVATDEFGKVQWEVKKIIIDIAKKVPYVDIITTALGHVR